MKRILTLIIPTFFLLFGYTFNGHAAEQNEISQLASSFFKHMKQDDYLKASQLFHYPPTYTTEERKKDEIAVSKSLGAFKESFGQIIRPQIETENKQIISLQVGGGDIPYWQKHPQYFTQVYNVNFSKYGDGFITFTICNLTNKFEIREVKYGLLASYSNAIPLLKNSAKQIQLMVGYE